MTGIRCGPKFRPAASAFGLGLLAAALCGAAPPKPPVADADVARLEAAREQTILLALSVRQRERAIGALDIAVNVMERGVTAKQDELVQTRKEQEQLIGALARHGNGPPQAGRRVHHEYRTRGSNQPYARSTNRLVRTMTTANSRLMASIAG